LYPMYPSTHSPPELPSSFLVLIPQLPKSYPTLNQNQKPQKPQTQNPNTHIPEIPNTGIKQHKKTCYKSLFFLPT
jgi:hypothetical protein